MILDIVIDILVNLSYFAIVIAIFAGSVGIPIPEEIVLLIVGYLGGIGFYDVKTAMLVAFVSMIAADNFSYLLGYRGSKLVTWILKTTKTSWLRDHLKTHPCKTIFLSRFLSGARVFFPIAAGSIKMPWKKFFIVDFLAVLVLVPSFVLLGFYLRPHFDAVVEWIIRVDKFVLGFFIAVVLLSFFGIRIVRKKR